MAGLGSWCTEVIEHHELALDVFEFKNLGRELVHTARHHASGVILRILPQTPSRLQSSTGRDAGQAK